MRSTWHCQATIQGVNDRSPPPQPEVASAATSAPQPLQTAPHHASATLAAPVTHYENFPVASLLCPPHLRQPIAAIYGFSRTADDIADEGDAPAADSLADLAAYHAELLDYCRRSANPVGRLLLHLYGVTDAQALQESDAICTALQLINFWQDLSVDIPRGRHYLPRADCAVHGACQAELLALRSTPENVRLISDCARWARASMQIGAPLVHRLPGRAGWELRLVVQGGLRILDKVDALKGGSLHTRPRLHAWDWCVMLGRALVM